MSSELDSETNNKSIIRNTIRNQFTNENLKHWTSTGARYWL